MESEENPSVSRFSEWGETMFWAVLESRSGSIGVEGDLGGEGRGVDGVVEVGLGGFGFGFDFPDAGGGEVVGLLVKGVMKAE
jgi:hypothetical protein